MEPIISGNIISNNEGIIQCYAVLSDDYNGKRLYFCKFDLDRNTIWNDGELSIVSRDSSEINFVNSIIWTNSQINFSKYIGGVISAKYSNIKGGFVGENIIDQNPEFIDPYTGNFNLQIISPCIDAGDPDSEHDPDGTIADMGALPYFQSISPFSLQAPKNDTVIAIFTPEFAWHAAAGTGEEAIHYDLYYSKDNSFEDSLTTVISDIENTRYSVPSAFEEEQPYYWKVLARNPWSMEQWSTQIWHFMVIIDTIPPYFTQQLPELSFDEDDSLMVPVSYWYDFVEDAKCADSLLSITMGSGKAVYVTSTDTSTLFKTPENWFGTDTLQLMVEDRNHLSNQSQLRIIVNPINDPPTLTGLPDSLYFRNDSSLVLNLWEYAGDAETKDSLLIYEFNLEYDFQVDNDSILIVYDKASGNLNISATSQFQGEALLSVTVKDDDDAVDQQAIKIQVEESLGVFYFGSEISTEFMIYQNFPNPFNPKTTIHYSLPEPSEISLKVYNLHGKLVAEIFRGKKPAGHHLVDWDGTRYSSGTYFIRMDANEYVKIVKCILLK